MARHYTTKDFFRQMPNALLARYFHARGFFNDLDFAAMKEGKPDELFAAWLNLPEGQRNAMDTEFRDIFEMSCEKGFRAIIDEVEFHLDENDFTAWVEKLSALPSHFDRAMLVFLDHNFCWKGATRFIMRIRCLIGASARTCRTKRRTWAMPVFKNLPGGFALIFTIPRGAATTAWWSLSAGASWIIFSPTRKTTRSKAANG